MKKFGSGTKIPDRQHFFFSTVKFTQAPGYGSGIRINQNTWDGSGSSEYGSERLEETYTQKLKKS
jgi:hypothetical protein